jgi:hypothetical protein
MTSNELRKLFKIGMDKSSPDVYSAGVGFTQAEEEAFLNQAYIEVIKGKYNGNNPLNKSYEESKILVSDLSGLITNKDVAFDTTTGLIPNEYSITIPSGIMYVIHLVITSATTATPPVYSNTYVATEIMPTEAEKYIATSKNRPIIPNPVYMMIGDKIKIYVDPIDMPSLNMARFMCLREPTKIVLAGTTVTAEDGTKTTTYQDITEVRYDILLEVVDRAILIALQNIESPRMQTQIALEQVKAYQTMARQGQKLPRQ